MATPGNSGRALGDSVGTHYATLMNSPSEEWSVIKGSVFSSASSIGSSISYAYNNLGAALQSAWSSSVSYLDKLTTDPTVCGKLLGNVMVEGAVSGATAGLGNAIKGTQA